MTNPIKNRWALLVGINSYTDPHFSDLQYCVNDVLSLQALLQAAGYTTVCLHDGLDHDGNTAKKHRLPTRINIGDEIKQLCEQVEPDDQLLVYFACHGTRLENGDPVLVTSDTRQYALAERAISISELERWMRGSGAERLVLMLDACNIGLGTSERRVVDHEFIHNVHELATGFELIAASTYQESARELDEVEHGLFSHYVLQGLLGKANRDEEADFNFVSVNELCDYVQNELKKKGVSDGIYQQPMKRSDGNLGDMILADWRSHQPPKLEDLPHLHSSEAAARQRSANTLLKPYLQWLITMHRSLELRGIEAAKGYPTIPLEKIYVALKGDRTSAYERLQSREMLDAEAAVKMMASLEENFSYEEQAEMLEYFRRQILVEHPHMLSLVERDRGKRLPAELSTDIITLGEAFQKERWLVILGDPGSGKTTLARWLTVKLAKALLTQQPTLEVLAHQVNPDVEQSDAMLSLGTPRLPVIVRVSDYAEAYKKSQLTLIDYLGHHPWLGQYPSNAAGKLSPDGLNLLIRDYLCRGQAVIILDGMDEITTSTRRDDVVLAIEVFIREWINTHGEPQDTLTDDTYWRYIREGNPLKVGGNQILITSRIAGYHASPIRGNITHVTIEPMTRLSVEHFCDTWMRAVYELGANEDSNKNLDALAQQANVEATNLKRAIYETPQRRIRELASNPLLVTTLAIVFHRRGQLPRHRASLYQLALEILVKDWQQDRNNRKNRQRTGFTQEELIHVLSPLAAHIHTRYATGLIQEPELREILSKHLAELPQYQEQANQPAFKQKIDQFLRVLREDVGLLAARGEYLYGFLHLTFQEYLAALFLVRDINTAAQKIIQRMDDPRWREPIVLALGHVGTEWGPQARNQLLQSLLNANDPLGDVLPRTPLLIANALDEMPSVPEDIFIEVAKKLLFAYADHQGIYQIEQLRHRIESALTLLRSGQNERLLDSVLCELLREPPANLPDVSAAVASLIQAQYWFTADVIEALFAGRPNDHPNWGWPIHAAIRDIVSFDSTIKQPEQPKSLDKEQLTELKETDLSAYTNLTTRYAIAQEAYQENLIRYESAQSVAALVLPLEQLPFRRALLQNEALADRARHSPDWLRLVTVLYGGYADYRAHDIFKDYDGIVQWLQMPDEARDDELHRDREGYLRRFDYGDVVYSAAVYLDTGMEGRYDRAKTYPTFAPQAIHRDSVLTNRLLAVLKSGKPATTLVPSLWKLWSDSSHAILKVEAMLALIVLGEEVTRALEDAFSSESHKPLASQVVLRLSQLHHELKDVVTRTLHTEISAGTGVDKYGKENKEKLLYRILNGIHSLEDEQWCLLIDCISELTVSYSNRGSDLPLPPKTLPVKAQARFLAERWSCRFLGGCSEDVVYNCAAALDEMSATQSSLLIETFSLLRRSHNLQWEGAYFEWKIEQLIPLFDSQQDFPLELIDIVSNSHLKALLPGFATALLPILLKAVTPIAKQNPALILEVLILYSSNQLDPEPVLKELLPNVKMRDGFSQRLVNSAKSIEDPYRRARAMLCLARYSSQQRQQYIQAAQQSAQAIANWHQRCRLLEYLLAYTADEQKSQILQELLTAAPKIKNPDDRSRTLGRISKHFSGTKKQYLIRAAIVSAAQIPDVSKRANLLELLTPLARKDSELLADLRSVARTLPEGWNRDKALGLKGRQMLSLTNKLSTTQQIGAHHELWSVLTVGATVSSLINYFQDDATSLDELWQQLAETTASQQQERIKNKLQILGLEKGLTLTRRAVQTVTLLVESGADVGLHELLSLLQNPTVEALPLIEDWLNHWDATLSHHAALYLAELNRQINTQTVDGLLALLSSPQDRSRARATLVIHGERGGIYKRKDRFFKASELDKSALLKLVKASLKPQHSIPRNWMLVDVLHDDPTWIGELIDAINRETEDADGAEAILRSMFELTSQSWTFLKQAVAKSNSRARKAVLESLCYMFVSENKMDYYEEPTSLLSSLGLDVLSQMRVLPTHTDPIIQAALSVLGQNPPSEKSAAIADRVLSDYAITVEDIMLDRGEIVRQLKKLPVEEEQPRDADPKSIMRLIGYIGNTLSVKVYTGELFRKIGNKDVLIFDNPYVFPLLVSWLQRSLQESIKNQDWYSKQTLLLTDVAIYARRSPSTFVNLARERKIEPLLAQAIAEHNHMSGRKAACELVSHFGTIHQTTLSALMTALSDDRHVKRAAMETITKLRRINGVIITDLIKALLNPSATVAAAAAQILATLGRSERTQLAQRRQITAALAEAVRSPHQKRGIYAIDGAGSDSSPKQLVYQGSLDQIILKALLETTGNL